MIKVGLIVMGVAASGKTTIAELLRDHLIQCIFKDADEFHSEANKKKMSSGTPLNDEDRFPWLQSISNEFKSFLSNEKYPDAHVLIITCSALKRMYRDILRDGMPESQIQIIYLAVSKEEAKRRIEARQHHFMKSNMIDSQFATLEVPSADEGNVLTVQTDTLNPKQIVEQVMNQSSFLAKSYVKKTEQ